jgi:NTE family protein
MLRNFFAVFAGGGVKGAGLLGAFEEARKHVNFVGYGGTSAGSIVAALLACGCTVEDLRKYLYEAPYPEFFRVSKWRLFFFGSYRGMVDPNPLLEWLRQLIGKNFPDKPRVTFKDLKAGQQLKIVATNVTTREFLIFSQATTPNFEIAQAVLASCSFPLLFPPVAFGNDEVVDGGVLSNFPMWLFDAEHDREASFTPVLGFALVSKTKKTEQGGFLTHAFSLFDSILVAQDRVQEKYMDIARSANVIRIDVGETPTFSTTQTRDQHNSLLLAGKEAASRFFEQATVNFGTPVRVPPVPTTVQTARDQVDKREYPRAVSTIVRHHILNGGVARDDGLLEDRVLVRYYIDLMAAVTDHAKLEILAQILAEKIKTLNEFDRIIGIKKGNVILSYEVARILKKPISLFKTDMSYKMGPPFDGPISPDENVIIVDDLASDASPLLNAVRQLHFRHATVNSVVTLVERMEGDARDRIMKERGVQLRSVCSVDDNAIRRLIEEDLPFSEG